MMWIALVLFLSACSQDSAPLATINGDPISVREFKLRLREVGFDQKLVAQEDLNAVKRYVLNELIEEKIIEQQGREMGIEVKDEEVSTQLDNMFSSREAENLEIKKKELNIHDHTWTQRAKHRLLFEKIFQQVTLGTPVPTEGEISEYYQKNGKQLEQKEQIQIAQVVVQDKMVAEKILERTKAGTPFEQIVQEQIDTPGGSGNSGYGTIYRGYLPEDVEKVVLSMKPGTLSPIIESGSDYYVVQVKDRIPQFLPTLDEARQKIQSMLWQEAKQKAYEAWLQEQVLKAKIKRNDDRLEKNFSL